MDIDGLGPAALEQLSAALQVHSPADLYDITAQELETLDRFGKKSAENPRCGDPKIERKRFIKAAVCARHSAHRREGGKAACGRVPEIWML